MVSDYGDSINGSCIVTDAVRDMLKTGIGFAGLLKQYQLFCDTLHCSSRDPMWIVIKVVVKLSYILGKGNRSLTYRKFHNFLT